MASSDCESRPVVGIVSYLERARYGPWDVEAALLPRTYVDVVVSAGGSPVLLPPVAEWQKASLSFVDALVLAGGPDVDPGRYGQPAHPGTDAPRVARDAVEFALLRAAVDADIPVLGVCRGMQVLNVAFGGTLSQHLPDVTGSTVHRPVLGEFTPIEVELAPGSRVAGALGRGSTVSCHHHQAIDRLGAGLDAVGWAADGVIEAVELSTGGFVLGVQWHPEQDAEVSLFKALVDETRRRR
ncbi:MAG: gamma-glutamyl-gamma-aminobutyrate hydrolase family protein [Kutzneria sp.]|nr:gamma-glutamyl-gamma-aminobutyrate hydrolase family protein [Kutzneria sp.]MBV9847900.1 gamma-glutamyl-gamma-aminobutyrate hydrolase family protein [Kutzneria sp.]